MNNIGYVCALATSALEGAVYVGKTTRPPAEWASELSKIMRLSSPFIVAYEQLSEDYEESARFVCKHLERKGYRIFSDGDQDGRFVHASVREVVKAILIAPGALDDEDFDAPRAKNSRTGTHVEEELDFLQVPPWADIYEEAQNYYYGTDSYLEDRAEAYRLFQEAASLGCPSAYRFLGSMARYGNGVKANERKALEYFKEGARIGSVICYLEMADLFIETGQSDNAEKCASMFVGKFSYDMVDEVFITESDVNKVNSACAMLIKRKLSHGVTLPPSLRSFMIDNASNVRTSAENFVNLSRARGNIADESRWQQVIRVIDSFSTDPGILSA